MCVGVGEGGGGVWGVGACVGCRVCVGGVCGVC